MNSFFKTLLITLFSISAAFSLNAKDTFSNSGSEYDLVYIKPSAQLSEFYARALSEPILGFYMAHIAKQYDKLFQDPSVQNKPLKDRNHRLYIFNPDNKKDTMFQMDVRVYSPSMVGDRYNRMIIIRPYDKVKRPCVLYTHGNSGDMEFWANYYLIGAASMLQRGYAVAFYENYNNSIFNSKGATDNSYKEWVKKNLEDNTKNNPIDHVLHRGHYLLYQYAYAAQTYLTYIADEYDIDKSALFTAGFSAGGLASMQLTFGRPERNFKHPVFAMSGPYNDRVFKDIPDRRIPIKGVFSGGAGLQDASVKGSYFGQYLDKDHQDKVVVMAHGMEDPLAPVNRGPALWSRFVDTIKLLGPVSLHDQMNKLGIKNYAFINCVGGHGIYLYPATTGDKSGVFKNLAPFSYNSKTLSNDDFFKNVPLYQIYLYYQQMDKIMDYVSGVFTKAYRKQPLNKPSAIYTWEPNQFTVPLNNVIQDWEPRPQFCKLQNAVLEEFLPELYPQNLHPFAIYIQEFLKKK